MEASVQFNKKQPEGTIDVWWMFDDGGRCCFPQASYIFYQIYLHGGMLRSPSMVKPQTAIEEM